MGVKLISTRTAFLVLLLSLAAAPAGAQVCIGRPIGGLAGHAAVAQAGYAAYDLDERLSGVDVGASYWGNPRGFIAYSAGFARRFMEGGGGDLDLVRADASAELPALVRLPPGAGGCLTAGAAGAWIRDQLAGTDFSALSLPIGLGFGLTLPAGAEARLHPYLHPQLVFTTSDGEVIGFEVTERYTSVALEAGVGFARGPVVGRLRLLAGDRPEGAGLGPIPDFRGGLEVGIRF